MVFDYKKEYKEFYNPGKKPSIVEVPPMNYLAIRGKGDPNDEEGEYQQSIPLLYGVAYTLKMSKKTDHQIEGYFDYVVPPLEGLWWQENIKGMDYNHKELLQWISLIRLPDFITKEDVEWAKEMAAKKKKMDFSKVEFFHYEEGLCVQCTHMGSYDDEPITVDKMHDYITEDDLLDINNHRFHHEIYLSDPRRVSKEKRKTVVRHPIKQEPVTK